jgi:sugar phosphate isomerase/epimerase
MRRFSISQVTTLTSSFADDLEAYRAAGAEGVGVWELKLAEGGDGEALERFEASGLGSAAAVPVIPSILPLPLMEGPSDPRERVEAICRSLHRLASFRPSGVVCLTGPAQERDPDEAREVVVEGLRTIGEEAARAGVRVGLEPINRVGGEVWTIISSIPEAVELLEAADRPALGLQLDTWHLWNTETLLEDIEREAGRVVGVHVADWREPTRSWADRVLPGDGVADLPAILGTLERAGWDGFYDLEIFSDNGMFGNAWPDSLWDVPPQELARRGREAFDRVWDAGNRMLVDQVSPGALIEESRPGGGA